MLSSQAKNHKDDRTKKRIEDYCIEEIGEEILSIVKKL